MQRRTVLKLALAGALGAVPRVVSRAYAAPDAADAKFLLVFLRGGYDAAHVGARSTTRPGRRSRSPHPIPVIRRRRLRSPGAERPWGGGSIRR